MMYLGQVFDLEDVCFAASIVNPLPLSGHVIILIMYQSLFVL